MVTKLRTDYKEKIINSLYKSLNCTNIHQALRLPLDWQTRSGHRKGRGVVCFKWCFSALLDFFIRDFG
jgi:hypothetical protein